MKGRITTSAPRSEEAEGGKEAMRFRGFLGLIGIGVRDRWLRGLVFGMVAMICWSLADWTGYDRFHPEGQTPLPLMESLLRGAISGGVVFLLYTLWPSTES